MKESTENQAKGKMREIKGRVKAGVGAMTGNADMEARGHMERISGKAQKKTGDIQENLGE